MNGESISLMITQICHDLNINYSSVNPEIVQLYKDAIALRDIYLQLIQIEAKLVTIEERHEVNGLGELLRDDIVKLENISHHVIKLAHKLKEE